MLERRSFTPAEIAKMMELHRAGYSNNDISNILGRSKGAVTYKIRCIEYKDVDQITAKKKELQDRKSSIPEDTRCLTGLMFGDPLPGRSALDQKGGVL